MCHRNTLTLSFEREQRDARILFAHRQTHICLSASSNFNGGMSYYTLHVKRNAGSPDAASGCASRYAMVSEHSAVCLSGKAEARHEALYLIEDAGGLEGVQEERRERH